MTVIGLPRFIVVSSSAAIGSVLNVENVSSTINTIGTQYDFLMM